MDTLKPWWWKWGSKRWEKQEDDGVLDSSGRVTCVWGKGWPSAVGLVAGRPTLLLSSSRARLSCSNCTSCSLTDSSRAAAFSHCSIHTDQPKWWEGGIKYNHTDTRRGVRKITTGTPRKHELDLITQEFSVWFMLNVKKKKKTSLVTHYVRSSR